MTDGPWGVVYLVVSGVFLLVDAWLNESQRQPAPTNGRARRCVNRGRARPVPDRTRAHAHSRHSTVNSRRGSAGQAHPRSPI